jgi:hypothetical protein
MGCKQADRDFFALLARNGIQRQGFNVLTALDLFFQFYEELRYDDCAGDQLLVGWQRALCDYNVETGARLPPPHAEILVFGVERVLTEPEVRQRPVWNPQDPIVPLNIRVVLHLPLAPEISGCEKDDYWCHRRADSAEFFRRIRAHPLVVAVGTLEPTAVIQCVGSDIRFVAGPLPQ